MFTVAGFALNLHYCCNKLVDIGINAPADSCEKPMAKSKLDCCKNSHLTIKIKDAHQKECTSFGIRMFAFDLPGFQVFDFLSMAQQLQSDGLADHSPPDIPLNGIPVFLKNCNFRI